MNKNVKTKLFLFLLVLVATPFYFWKNSLADEALKITTIQYGGGSGKSDEDYIEITNNSTSKINLDGYRLVKRSASANIDTNLKSWTSDTIIPAGGKHTWANSKNGFAEKIGADSSTTATISEGNQIALRLGKIDEGTIIDSINWKESIEEEPDDDPDEKETDYTGKLKINEIFPAPKTKNNKKEFVEIINLSDEKINLSGMWIEDEKKHKVSFPDEKLEPGGLFVLEGKFELNDTSADSAFLVDKNGTKEKPLNSVSYEKPQNDYAYAFDGTTWQWTSKITKGTKNQFDELLSGKIKKDKKIYANVYANFEVSADKKTNKFTWDFGDGHKSYLKKTRHKYEKAGTYQASLRLRGDGKENTIFFSISVSQFKKVDVEIESLSPNPAGKDAAGEWIVVKNNTKKKLDLKNWSIATGTKKLTNHPIKKKFEIKAGKSKKLTRKECAFSLGNKAGKIELRYPNGKVADKLKYDHENKSISEDELYQKADNTWQWVLPENAPGAKTHNATEIKPTIIALEVKNEEPRKTDFDLSALGKSTENPAWREKQKNQTVLLLSGSNISPLKLLIQNQGRVLGISTIRPSSHNYAKDAKILKFSDQLWRKINAKLNEFILLL